ncbi:Protein of unknown function [Bacillus mycoides]|nr:Protein of unknown function [Bacillus mycoides]
MIFIDGSVMAQLGTPNMQINYQ